MHLSGTGFPYERGSNTYIVGHAADYDQPHGCLDNRTGPRQRDHLAPDLLPRPLFLETPYNPGRARQVTIRLS